MRVAMLFDETDIEPYTRRKAEVAFDAVLAATGWTVNDVIAVAQPLSLLVIARAGIVESNELGFLKKRIEVGEIVPWDKVLDATQTEPTLRVYGIDVTVAQESRARSYVWSGGGSEKARKERDRIYRFLTGNASSC